MMYRGVRKQRRQGDDLHWGQSSLKTWCLKFRQCFQMESRGSWKREEWGKRGEHHRRRLAFEFGLTVRFLTVVVALL